MEIINIFYEHSAVLSLHARELLIINLLIIRIHIKIHSCILTSGTVLKILFDIILFNYHFYLNVQYREYVSFTFYNHPIPMCNNSDKWEEPHVTDIAIKYINNIDVDIIND